MHRLRALRCRVPLRRLLARHDAGRDAPPVRPEWRLPPEQAEHFLRSRRSIGVFKEIAVATGRLERLIRTARYAPSGHNSQPVRWLVISGREPVRALAGLVIDWMRSISPRSPSSRARDARPPRRRLGAGRDLICRDAPHLIVTHAPKNDVTAPSACTLALAYLELAAPSHGLGACWAGYLQLAALHWQPLQEALALPAGDTFTAPAGRRAPLPLSSPARRRDRRSPGGEGPSRTEFTPRFNERKSDMNAMHEVDYKIFGEDLQFVEVELDPQEAVVAEAGAMMYMEDGVEMETIFGDGSAQQQAGDLMGALLGAGKRLLTGESPP